MSRFSDVGGRLCMVLAVFSLPLLGACDRAEAPTPVPTEQERSGDKPTPPATVPADPTNPDLPEGSTGLGGQRKEGAGAQ
jgi:hypothetical protein